MRGPGRLSFRGPRLGAAVLLAVALAAALLGPAPRATGTEANGTAGAPGSVAGISDPASYPARPAWLVKGLQPDLHPDPAAVADGVGTVSQNLMWAQWEPVFSPPPCAPGQLELEGHCFSVPPVIDDQIRGWTDLGVPVTAIVYGTPAWARGSRICSPVAPGFEIFCIPDDPHDYARFARLIADRYDGTKGHGRISDFVIQNEVNTNAWFDVGCGGDVRCDLEGWVRDYAAIYNAAYDVIRAEQPGARVLTSFTHHFGRAFDAVDGPEPIVSIQTFLPRLAPMLGDREWSVALHPYAKLAFVPIADARDLPFATLGNLGVVPGWLRATFPDHPHAWDVELTEQGVHNDGRYDEEQKKVICRTFHDVLGTPGISSFIYHRLKDNPDEFLLKLGLWRQDGTPKPAWELFRTVNDPSTPQCGFELLPHTVVVRGRDPATGRWWHTSRTLPEGYTASGGGWPLLRDPTPGTALLFECGDSGGTATWLRTEPDCAGAVPMGPVGYVATTSRAGYTELASCRGPDGELVTTATACPAGSSLITLGYVEGGPEALPVDGEAAEPPPAPVAAVPAFTG